MNECGNLYQNQTFYSKGLQQYVRSAVSKMHLRQITLPLINYYCAKLNITSLHKPNTVCAQLIIHVTDRYVGCFCVNFSNVCINLQ